MSERQAASSRSRAVFFGTPAFAVPILDALAEVADVVGVVCQPDKPSGRGLALSPPAVKVRAETRGYPLLQPVKVRTGELTDWVREKRADVAVVVAYGRILPQDVLDAPRLGCLNVHASLLPRYRGAAPITWCLVRGERETGVTLMQMDAGMDTGAMLVRRAMAIGPEETAGELGERLSRLGAETVREELPRFLEGALIPEAQDEAAMTLAPMLSKGDGAIDFAKSAQEVHDHVRGMTPWPGAFTFAQGKRVKVLATRVATGVESSASAPGTVLIADKSRVIVACGRGAVEIVTIQLEGKKPISAGAWVSGRGITEADRLG